MNKEWCPKCQAYVQTMKHEYPTLLETEYRCLKCGCTIKVVHYGVPTKKGTIPPTPPWEVG